MLNIMKKKKGYLAAIIATIVFASLAGFNTALAQPPGVKRTELQRRDLSSPGREAVQVRIDFDAGTGFGKHTHPGEEIIYVLDGFLEYQIEDKPPVRLKAGDVLFIPAGSIHAARNVGKGNAKELATYIVDKGKPLVVLLK
jgi:quercetin dioxygenase-like cupin family protein